ncbi:multidrug resistance-associated protein 4-like isoform X2 [Lucilia sericata]|uniref:multidrug resistance-associated protein 4-like isoform X2 n=1 Tax=Lucilia sericata TaxID=13632 RepID=UPI0018A7F98E|nr:multidrug resistance-associated protein 4-like isoform X2 [Lucilia sericata]
MAALEKESESDTMYDDILPTKINPRQKANIFSQLIFAWIIPLLYKGSKQGLREEDLPKCLPDDESKVLGDKLERHWRQELLTHEMSGRKPSLRRALWKTIWPSAVIDGSICLFYIMLKSLIPLSLAQLLIELQNTQTSLDSLNHLSTTDDLNKTIQDDNKSNLKISNQNTQLIDAQESENWFWFWHDIYVLGAILVGSTFIGCFINHHVDQRQKRMGAKMRIACCSLILRKSTKLSLKTAGDISVGHIVNLISNDVNRLDIGFVFAHYLWILPIQTVLIVYLIWLRLGYAAIIGVVALLLQTIPVQIYLSTWTAKLRNSTANRTDARIGIMNELIRGIQVIKMYAWEICFQKVVKESRRLEIRETRKAAYMKSFYLSSMILPERLTLFITIVAAVQIGTIISADAIFSIANLYHVFQLVAGIFCPMAISFASEAFVSIARVEEFLKKPEIESIPRRLPHSNNAVEIENVTASWDASKPTLRNISLVVPKGKLCVIAGPVGSGKSSLLQLILGELNADQGSIKVEDDISYASQEPWLFSGTIKKNILFTAPYKENHYKEVVEKCSLIPDFGQLHYKDNTLVGERGAALSGGQKARINLARAVYNQSSTYLFDDPLSAVDANVGRNLYEQVIGPRGLLQDKTRILVTHQTQYITEEADLIVWVEEGGIRSGNFADMHEIIASQVLRDDKKIENEMQKQMANGEAKVEREEEEPKESDALLNGKLNDKELANDKEQVVSEDQGNGCVKASVWWAYFHAGNSVCGLIFITFVLIISQAVCSGADYFVNIYTKIVFMDSHNQDALISEELCLIIYSILIVAAIFMIIFRCYLFLKTCMHASKVLHDRMFGCILKATMRFFDTNPSGRILNRFSKDMGAIDESLPRFMSEFTHLALVMLGVLVVICIVNPLLLVAVVAVGLVDFVIIKLYLRSSQDLKRLEGIRRSPVFSHVSATLSGLSTIRSRKRQNNMIAEFDNLQDIHSAAYHLTLTSNTALGLWLDCANVSILLNSVTFSFILLNDNGTYSGNVGLAITQAMMLTGMVQYGLRQLGEAFQQMTSVERILEYTKLQQEKTSGQKPAEKWPNAGVIKYNEVNVRYHENGQLVLKDLNFAIDSGWKIGIVGRTGAGKTSLISSLFRLSDCITGSIIIDGRDTSDVDLTMLRSSLSIIPQEPVLFKGTIRYNLDPFNKYKDNEMWEALRNVQLGRDLPLDFEVTEYGSNLSIGQRQLICLARALLGHNSILVMDEATANVDQNTDQQIQQTIQQNFAHCTVITVAHRLKTVMKSDRIMVLDNGELKEFGIPHILLQKPNGYLQQMVKATGEEANNLIEMAKECYNGE